MNTIKQIEDSSGNWVFIMPVQGLRLNDAVNFEFKVHRVTFIDSKRITGRRKRLGIPHTISSLKRMYRGLIDSFFYDHKTFATLRLTGKGKELTKRFVDLVRDELDILSLSQLGFSRRRYNSSPSIYYTGVPERISSLMFNLSTNQSYHPSRILGKIGQLNLDERWRKFSKAVFFYDLIDIISGYKKISPALRNNIKHASILAGQSQTSIDIPQSFVLNMIALESLLTDRNDRYSEKLPERMEAFIGWATDWKVNRFYDKIRKAYQKRCQFVHTGNGENISIEDILFTDDLLINVLRNIVKHPKLFGSKRKIIEFSDKVHAENVLNIKPQVRPKTLSFLRMNYKDDDYEKI